LVGALLIGVIAVIVAMAAGLNTARDQARDAYAMSQAQQIAAGEAVAAEAAAAYAAQNGNSGMADGDPSLPASPLVRADGDAADDGDETMSVEELAIASVLENRKAFAITSALEKEDYDTAEKLARELVARDPNDRFARALLQMVRIERAVAAGDIASADALLSEARELAIELDPFAALGVADLWIAEGEPARGLAIADLVVKSTTGTTDDARYFRGAALVVRGMAKAELGDLAGGAKDLEDSIELAPDEETAAEWQQYLDEIREKSR
jgi:tetratricopeptide (TPR) repeat protein